MATPWAGYWIVQNVNYNWTQVHVNPYVKIILHAMQITSYLTKVHINHTKDTSWKWSVHQCAVYNTSYCRHTWAQI